MPKDSAEPRQEQKSRSTLKVIIIVLLALNLLIAGAAAGYFMFINPTAGEPPPPKLAGFELGEMLVNLADPSGMHYLRFTAVLEYDADQKELAKELSEKQHILQHNVIALLRTKKLADVQPPDSVESVQREMTAEINKLLEKGKISRVYFTEYLTQ